MAAAPLNLAASGGSAGAGAAAHRLAAFPAVGNGMAWLAGVAARGWHYKCWLCTLSLFCLFCTLSPLFSAPALSLSLSLYSSAGLRRTGGEAAYRQPESSVNLGSGGIHRYRRIVADAVENHAASICLCLHCLSVAWAPLLLAARLTVAGWRGGGGIHPSYRLMAANISACLRRRRLLSGWRNPWRGRRHRVPYRCWRKYRVKHVR